MSNLNRKCNLLHERLICNKAKYVEMIIVFNNWHY